MHFLQQAPAETSVYMIAGYVIIFGTMLLYLVSLVVRQRNLKQDFQALQEIEASVNAPSPS